MRTKSVEFSRLFSVVIVGIFALIFSLIALTSSLQKSPTFDETIHLFAGYSYLRWGELMTNPEHPPLAKALAAVPLLALGVKTDFLTNEQWNLVHKKQDYAWVLAKRMVFVENDAETLFFLAKLPMILLGALLGTFIYIWARETYGFVAGIAALSIFCLDPNILAHTSIVHTDIPFAAFFFIGSYFFWRSLNCLTWQNMLLASIFFALSAVTKFSFFAVLLVWVVVAATRVVSSTPQRSSITLPHDVFNRWLKASLSVVIVGSALVAAYVLIWAGYGFLPNPVHEGVAYYFPLDSVTPPQGVLRSIVSFVRAKEIFPQAWLYGLLHTFKLMHRSTYLMGDISDEGFWLYFPVAFLVKTPLPTLLMLLVIIGTWVRRRRIGEVDLVLLIPIVIYFALAVWSRMNIGLRHVLPIYPFLFVLIGGVVAECWADNGRFKRGALIGLALWYLWSSASVYPHYLAYFNEFVGGPKHGYKILVDSNLDWGQDLKFLKQWMDKKKIESIYLAYFGTADPAYYGIRAVYLQGSPVFAQEPARSNSDVPRYVAVSATHLAGVYLKEREFFRTLRSMEPEAVIGHSIFVYRLTK